MHARLFAYRLTEGSDAAVALGRALARHPGYRGRLLVAAPGGGLLDWHLHDAAASALRAWETVRRALAGPQLAAAIELLGEGEVVACDCAGLRGLARPGGYARVAAAHYPPDDPPDDEHWGAILRAVPGYRGRLIVAAGQGRLLTLAAYDAAGSYTAARDSPAMQHFIATELAPRWTAPTRQLGAGPILAAAGVAAGATATGARRPRADPTPVSILVGGSVLATTAGTKPG